MRSRIPMPVAICAVAATSGLAPAAVSQAAPEAADTGSPWSILVSNGSRSSAEGMGVSSAH
jgi:hypothetical protein